LRQLALDANLLVLLIVGSVRPSLVRTHRRLDGYSEQDFTLLGDVVKQASDVSVTPYVLAEVSNLINYGGSAEDKAGFRQIFRSLVPRLTEVKVSSTAAVAVNEFMWLDLTDSGWLVCLNKRQILLTDDDKLRLAARARGLSAIGLQDIHRYR
jgi:hypothetical protein